MAREGFEPPPDHHQYDLCNMCLCDILISLSNFESEIFSCSSVDRSKLSTTHENFQLRVRIISACQLAGSNLRPVVRVKVDKGQTKTTAVRKGTSPIWNEVRDR